MLGENASPPLLYVAMTRGRHTNTAHLYERAGGDHEYGPPQATGAHVKHCGGSHDAATLVRAILANDDQDAITARDYATRNNARALPARVRSLLEQSAAAVQRRRLDYQRWETRLRADQLSTEQSRSRKRPHVRLSSRGEEYGIDVL